MQTPKYLVDTLTAGSTSLVAGAMVVPPIDLTPVHTIWIPLISGLLAPLIKELIITLRESRKRRNEEKNKKD